MIYDMREWTIRFFAADCADDAFDDGSTFGCSVAGCPANYGITPKGIVVCGDYREIVRDVQQVKAQHATPHAMVVITVRNGFAMEFLSKLNAIVGKIPVAGGGVIPAANREGRTVPHTQDAAVLLIYDDRYRWTAQWYNFHETIREEIQVRAASKHVILSIREDGQDVAAQAWYHTCKERCQIAPDDFEQIAFSNREGYNLHLSNEGEFALHTGSDVPFDGRLSVRKLNRNALVQGVKEQAARKNSLLFACAGLKRFIPDGITLGENAAIAFFGGEILRSKDNIRFSNLILSSLIGEIAQSG